jgi:hypothetical protein
MYAFSLPTKADKVPTGSGWIHEIKFDVAQNVDLEAVARELEVLERWERVLD